VTTVLHGVPLSETAERSPLPRASLAQRAGALVLDGVVLSAGFVGTILLELSLFDDTVLVWLFLVWLLVVTPLYFALYHAFGGPERGPGWTPGQHELGVCVCDARTGGRIGLGRALARSYGGLLAVLLVVPLLLDLVSLVTSPERRAWHDRLSGSTVARVPGFGVPPADWPETVEGLGEVFEPAGAPGRQAFGRARLLVRGNRRLLVGSTLAAYVGLMALAAVLAPLLVADLGDEWAEADALFQWLVISFALFTSGVFWTQAVLATATESIRSGEGPRSVGAVIRASSYRANALTVALLPLALLVLWTLGWIFPVLLLARFAMVVPAIVLEDTSSLGAFRRSWRLTSGRTGTATGLLLASGLALAVAIGLAAGLATAVVAALLPDAGAVASAVGIAAALGVAAVPVSFLLARVGCAWCLFYHDLRRAQAAPKEGGDGSCSRSAS
jgi:hypothetical protein